MVRPGLFLAVFDGCAPKKDSRIHPMQGPAGTSLEFRFLVDNSMFEGNAPVALALGRADGASGFFEVGFAAASGFLWFGIWGTGASREREVLYRS